MGRSKAKTRLRQCRPEEGRYTASDVGLGCIQANPLELVCGGVNRSTSRGDGAGRRVHKAGAGDAGGE